MKRRKRQRCCETCANLIPIDEGDHICSEVMADSGEPAIMPVSDYMPTDEYFKCGGEKWEEN